MASVVKQQTSLPRKKANHLAPNQFVSSFRRASLIAGMGFAQEPPKPNKPTLDPSAGVVEIDANNPDPLAKSYLDAVESLRKSLKALRAEFVLHQTERISDKPYGKLEEWSKLNEQSRREFRKVLETAGKLFRSQPEKYKDVGKMLFFMLQTESEADRFEGMTDVANDLIAGNFQEPNLFQLAGQAALNENRYDEAIASLKTGTPGITPEQLEEGTKLLEALKQRWEKELAIREKEEMANDLPRVELLTSKGPIVIELFENEAPETVGHFVYLVEKGFYDGKTFFRVLEHFVAQSGCERGDGTGSAGYTIRGEMGEPNARNHFRGSIGVALGADPRTGMSDRNSGSAQFYFCLMPQLHMDSITVCLVESSRGSIGLVSCSASIFPIRRARTRPQPSQT